MVTKGYIMRLTIFQVVSHIISLDPTNTSRNTSTQFVGSISQVRSLRAGEMETLGQSFMALRGRKGRDSTPCLELLIPLNLNQQKKMPTNNPGAQGTVQEAHKKGPFLLSLDSN